MEHKIKIDPIYFEQVLSGEKTFEVRWNDRGYQKGDTIVLMKTMENGVATNSTIRKEIIYVHSGLGMKEGFVVLGIKDCTKTVVFPKLKKEIDPERIFG